MSAFAAKAALTSSTLVVSRDTSHTRSTTEPVMHRRAHGDAVQLAVELGETRPIAFAAPVEVGTRLTRRRARGAGPCAGASWRCWSAV